MPASIRFRARALIIVAVGAALLIAAPAAAEEEPPPAEDVAGAGVVDPDSGRWWLRDPDNGQTTSFYYGNPGDFPIMGDWDCDGIDTPGLYRQSDGFVYLRNVNTQGNAHVRFFFGNPGDVPLAGDFDDDGCDTVSIYRPSQGIFYIINELGSEDEGLGVADIEYPFGNLGDKPFVGDFDGDGTDTVGLHRETTGLVYYLNSHRSGDADDSFIYGNPGDRLIAGDWSGDDLDSPGVFRPSHGVVYLKDSIAGGGPDEDFLYGGARMNPVAGVFGPLPGGDAPPPRDVFLVAQFTTYHSCCENRVTNIHIMANAIDGVVVAPGETFSLNTQAGPRTEAKGYLRAGAIIGGKLYCCDHPVNVGGGVSQLATTLFNAVFFGGYEDVEHRPHSIYFSRYPMGREATVVFPKPDVIFRNDTLDSVRIDTSYTSTSITVRLYGNDLGRSVTSSLSGWATTSDGGTVRVTRTIRHASGTTTSESWTHKYNPKPKDNDPEPTPAPDPDPDPGPDPGPGPGPNPD